jgi:hypothetical protein
MLVARARGHQPAIPLVERYDHYERVTSAPLPYLFQRSPNGTPMVIGHQGARDAITRAAARAKLHDVNGQPLRLVPHDFRRLFATEAVNGGLPIHIAAKLLGHLDLNTTKGYVAVYPEQVVRHFQAHLARRRARRPSQEYREPTTQEWDGFQQHFRRRRMALGDCYRPYGTDCPHEHACVRCPMLRMDPDQLPRLLQIEHDTHRLTSRGNGKGRPREALGCLARAGFKRWSDPGAGWPAAATPTATSWPPSPPPGSASWSWTGSTSRSCPRWSAPTSSGWRSDPHPGFADQGECSSRFCPRTGPAWVDHPWITG